MADRPGLSGLLKHRQCGDWDVECRWKSPSQPCEIEPAGHEPTCQKFKKLNNDTVRTYVS